MINGNPNPIVGKDEYYTLVDSSLGLTFSNTAPKYKWRIKKKVKGTWKDITKEPQKTGLSTPFKFGEAVIGEQFVIEAYKETKNILTQKNEIHKMGELIVVPKSSKEPKITQVVLFNRGARDVNKASYTDRLIARAYCVGMFNKTINFHLWEDDAPKGGHNAEINKNNRHNKAYPARVNIDGIAEAVISLAADQKVLRQVANKMMMKGDKDEGQYHEFYVTASYDGKILNANQTNVDVINPDYKKEQPKPKSTSTPTKPAQTSKPAPSPKKDESLVAKSINFVIDAVVGAFETPEKTKSPAMVKSVPAQKTTTTCICKEQYKDLVWGGKVSCEFRKKVVQICAELWGESRKMEMANGLMAVMAVETRGSFKAQQLEGWRSYKNPNEMTIQDFWKDGNRKSSRAVGLIQFTQDALQNNLNEYKSNPNLSIEERFDELNKLKLSYAKMGEIKQLDKVKKYFEPSKNNIKSPEDIYLKVFAPIGVGKSDDYVLYQKYDNPKTDKEKTNTKNYNANQSVDTKSTGIYKSDNKIQRSEILERLHESLKEGKEFLVKNYTCNILDEKKTEEKENNKWHNPVENPRLTKYNFDGNIKPSSGTYGECRRTKKGEKKYHGGFDFFAIPGKDKVYSCLKGNIYEVRYSANAGWIVRIKIQNVKDLLEQEKKVNYKLQYADEWKGRDIKESDNVYLIYMHLDSVSFTENDARNKREVEAGTVLGYAGVSGSIASGGRAPHLHMEIATVLDPFTEGRQYRTNPARFVKLNSYDTKDQDEAAKKPHYFKK
ncbi:M23 family metallopeptidase [Chryseobacterium oryctis]|uniref:M23 family metallopeptidase n=1 Tax=Chryseobacterium oryctis TaxID=2952618 RepID=A0ABT3HNZ3_9FLAO|nr:M23 family metallopeptidase [Chryseobacterium oryctis]MCW3161468.1 M23 family metallopeptidase [Chryseobacterium oryctis]